MGGQMVHFRISWIVFFFPVFLKALTIENPQNCSSPSLDEEVTLKSDWNVVKSRKEMGQNFDHLYESGKRLPSRAYWDSQKKSVMIPYQKKIVPLPDSIIQTISDHLRQALRLGYADFLYYPDLGHTHIFVPNQDAWGDWLKNKNLKFVYHSAELLKMKKGSALKGPLRNEEWVRWRYYTRNLMGSFDPGGSLQVLFASKQSYNTVHQIEGHSPVTTLYFSASRKGCFSILNEKKEKISFDLSFLY